MSFIRTAVLKAAMRWGRRGGRFTREDHDRRCKLGLTLANCPEHRQAVAFGVMVLRTGAKSGLQGFPLLSGAIDMAASSHLSEAFGEAWRPMTYKPTRFRAPAFVAAEQFGSVDDSVCDGKFSMCEDCNTLLRPVREMERDFLFCPTCGGRFRVNPPGFQAPTPLAEEFIDITEGPDDDHDDEDTDGTPCDGCGHALAECRCKPAPTCPHIACPSSGCRYL